MSRAMTVTNRWSRSASAALLLVVVLMMLPLSLAAVDSTLTTLHSLLQVRQGLQADVRALSQDLVKAESAAEKEVLSKKLTSLQQDLRATDANFEDLAAGARLAMLKGGAEEKFDIQQEFMALLRPALEEMKSMTSQMRKKADLKERIGNYSLQLPVIEQALAQIDAYQAQAGEGDLSLALGKLESNWRTQQALVQSELQSAQLQLQTIIEQEVSLTEASQSYLKSFFQKRGLYLAVALLVVLVIALLSRLNHYLLRRMVPGFSKLHRSFRVRLIELIHFIGTILLMVLGPILVFYIVEDWVLLSLSILVLIALLLTLRHTLPSYIQQIQIFLNIGTVREGERLLLDGLPWLVKRINVYSTLVNPEADLALRVHIDKLVGLRSRPCGTDEVWFPCRLGDWVMLSDGVRARVMQISEELVTLGERGGTRVTYSTANFIAGRPRNLSQGFRLKEVIGLSYAHQAEIVDGLPAQMKAYLSQRLQDEGYGDKLLDLKVELALANNSSLDLVMIVDFTGDVAELYGRLRRALQRMAVEACQQNGWEIPFPQLTLHGLPEPSAGR